MDLFDDLGKYHKMVKEEDNFNYNYNKILYPDKNNRRKLSQILLDNINIRKIAILDLKEKEKIRRHQNINFQKIKENKLIKDISFSKRESILQEKIFLEHIKRKKEIIKGNRKKIKGYFTKSHCPFCKKILSEKSKEPFKIENILTDINKINLYHSFKSKLNEEKKERMKLYKKTYDKKADMESQLTKNKRRSPKYKEVRREEIKVNNLFMIAKPLLTDMRGKIYNNTRKRIKKPLRLIILDSKNNKHPINTSNNN